MRSKIYRWTRIILVAYVLIGIVLYYLQDYILFHPVSLKRNQDYNFTIPYREINIPYDSASNFSFVRFLTDDSVPQGVVLFFHGNKKNIGWYARYPPIFTKKGYEVWMIDYPGFGKSTGRFTEQRLYDWAGALYGMARNRFSPDKITIYGRSMGTGIAAQLASVKSCRRIILETPYYSFVSLAQTWIPIYPASVMLHYKIPTWQYIQKTRAPVTIFQGDDDWIIPYGNAARLKEFLKPDDQFIVIKNGHHNNLPEFDLFQHTLDSLLAH